MKTGDSGNHRRHTRGGGTRALSGRKASKRPEVLSNLGMQVEVNKAWLDVREFV